MLGFGRRQSAPLRVRSPAQGSGVKLMGLQQLFSSSDKSVPGAATEVVVGVNLAEVRVDE